MRSFFVFLAVFVAGMAVHFLGVAFVAADLNPFDWPQEARLALVVFGSFFSLFAAALAACGSSRD